MIGGFDGRISAPAALECPMRTARGVCCLLSMLAATASPAAWADAPSSGTGPVYSVAAIRAFDLFGVHLGMKRDDARKAIAAAGLTIDYHHPGGSPHDVTSESYDVPGVAHSRSHRSFSVEYRRWPGRVSSVSGMTYYFMFEPGEAPDVEQRRADIDRRFGSPSSWSQWNGARGDVRYSAAYVPLASLVTDSARRAVTKCTIDWACLDGRERVDCRKILKGAHVPIVEIHLLDSLENYIVNDYEADYALLARTAEFHEPRSHAICPVPRVH
jgi:hypothetical protein